MGQDLIDATPQHDVTTQQHRHHIRITDHARPQINHRHTHALAHRHVIQICPKAASRLATLGQDQCGLALFDRLRRFAEFPGTATIAPSEPRGQGPNVFKDAPEGHLPADSVRCASTRRDGGWSAIAGQEALVPTGVVLRPFGAATRSRHTRGMKNWTTVAMAGVHWPGGWLRCAAV